MEAKPRGQRSESPSTLHAPVAAAIARNLRKFPLDSAGRTHPRLKDQLESKFSSSLADYDITPLATVLKLRRSLRSASIPSPLWSGALTWQPTGNGRLFNSARNLYQEIFDQRLTLHEEVRTQADFHIPGQSKGLLCWCEYLKTTSNENLDNDSDVESGEENVEKGSRDLNYAWVGENMDLDINGLKAKRKGEHEASAAGSVLHICRLQCKSETGDVQPGEFRHFILNFDQASLSINGIRIGMGMIGGPLPKFAVIGIDGPLLFWWGTAAALDFVPKGQSTTGAQKRLFSSSPEYENLGDNLRPPKRPKTNNSGTTDAGPTGRKNAGGIPKGDKAVGKTAGQLAWLQEYKRRLKSCSKSPIQTGGFDSTSEVPHQLDGYTNLGIDDVVLAIAAVRFGFDTLDRGPCFGNSDLYAHTRCQPECGMACVGTSHSFIMPLFFDESSKDLIGELWSNIKQPPQETFSQVQSDKEPSSKLNTPSSGKPRHCMLAFALCSENYEDVNIEFYDSDPAGEEKTLIRETARNLVRNSGWLRNKWPKFVNERWRQSPGQFKDTSGIHTILNAWSIMINLQVNEKQNYQMRSEFYAEAVKVINFALAGRLDSLAIRAFLQCSGYAQPQELAAVTAVTNEDLEIRDIPKRLLDTRAIRMNRKILEDVINRMHEEEYQQANRGENEQLPPRTYWEIKLEEGMRRHVEQAREQKARCKVRIRDADLLSDEEAHMAIASVWEGLRQAGFLFAFGTIATNRGNRTADMQIDGTEAVLGPEPMIIPLFFGVEMPLKKRPKRKARKGKGKEMEPIGHHVLAFVLRSQSSDDAAWANIFDSAPGHVRREEMMRAVNGLVRYTGWMGIDADGRPLPVTPLITFTSQTTPHQESALSCGFYLVLNAWAVMLGISIHPGRRRRIQTHVQRFFNEGVKIMNLALNGFMDSSTIQAFMIVHGYSVEPKDGEVLSMMNAVAMDEEKLDIIMTDLQNRAKDEVAQRITSYPPERLEELLNFGFEEKESRRALLMTAGDVALAIDLLSNES